MMQKKHYTELKGRSWNIWMNDDGSIPVEQLQVLLLQEVRDELKSMNSILHCTNFLDIPWILKQIKLNTNKPKTKKLKIAK